MSTPDVMRLVALHAPVGDVFSQVRLLVPRDGGTAHITFERTWGAFHQGITRADLVELHRAIGEALAETEPEAAS